MSGNGQDALPDVQEWSRCPPGCRGVVGRPFRMSGRCRETLLEVQKWCESLPDVREWSGGLSGCPGGPVSCPGVVGCLPDIRE